MTADVERGVFAALDEQLAEIKEARDVLDEREASLLRARAELERAYGLEPTTPAPRLQRQSRAGIQQKAAQHHVDAIHDYLKKHKTARQADIAKDLQLNSGTASLALRQLEEDGLVTPRERKDRGSVVWDFGASRAAPRLASRS